MATLSERLREETRRLSYQSIEYGSADSGIAANLADEAADALDALVAALEMAERHMVGMWRSINPAANYDEELTINGHVSGNRMADKDLVIQEVRAALARVKQ